MRRWARATRRGLLIGGGAIVLGGAAAISGGAARTRGIEAAHPPRGRFVEVDGLRVHYAETGAGDLPPVVLVHGATGNFNDMTFDLAPRLAPRRRVIAFDRPGLGYTDRPERDGWLPAVQAQVLRAAARALGVRRPVVLGHSWGAAVALAWALDAPDDVAGVVCVSGATMPWGGGDGVFTPVVTSRLAGYVGAEMLRLATAKDAGAAAAAHVFRPQGAPEGYMAHLQGELILRPASFRANTEDIERLDGALAEQSRRYPELRPSLAVLHGAADTITSARIHSVDLAARVPGAQAEIHEGVGHMLHHARPEAVVAAVDKLSSA